MKVIKSNSYNKSYKNKKLQKQHKQRVEKIINLLIIFDNFSEMQTSSLASIYKFERLKHDLNWAFSFRLDNKKIRLIVKPNSVEDYNKLIDEKEILLCDISFDHYNDL